MIRLREHQSLTALVVSPRSAATPSPVFYNVDILFNINLLEAIGTLSLRRRGTYSVDTRWEFDDRSSKRSKVQKALEREQRRCDQETPDSGMDLARVALPERKCRDGCQLRHGKHHRSQSQSDRPDCARQRQSLRVWWLLYDSYRHRVEPRRLGSRCQLDPYRLKVRQALQGRSETIEQFGLIGITSLIWEGSI
jgi:hypothetical protein